MQYRITGLTVAALGGVALAPAAGAQTLDLTVTIPKKNVAEYHRPYVAVWLEKDGVAPRTIAVWYDYDLTGKENGTKWLRDIRTWWRAAGRGMTFPADGITGATRAPGAHKLNFVGGRGAMPNLTPGAYRLMTAAAREGGGYETVAVPFNWDGSKAVSASAKGTGELGAVALTLTR